VKRSSGTFTRACRSRDSSAWLFKVLIAIIN
jgi:hypothetical protein